MTKIGDAALELGKAGASITAARLLENKVVGGFAASAIQILGGFFLRNVEGWETFANVWLGYGGASLVKRLVVKDPSSFLGSSLPGNTGEGIFMLKLGKGAGVSGLRGLTAEQAQFALRGAEGTHLGQVNAQMFQDALVA